MTSTSAFIQRGQHAKVGDDTYGESARYDLTVFDTLRFFFFRRPAASQHRAMASQHTAVLSLIWASRSDCIICKENREMAVSVNANVTRE